MLKEILKYIGIGISFFFGSVLIVFLLVRSISLTRSLFMKWYDPGDATMITILTLLIFALACGGYGLYKAEKN